MSEPTTPFDWETVLRRLDGEQPGSSAIEPDLVAAMRRLLLIVCSPPSFRARADARRAGVRMYALVWLTDPSIIPGAPGLRELASLIGCPVRTLSRITGRMSRELGLRNRSQRLKERQQSHLAARHAVEEERNASTCGKAVAGESRPKSARLNRVGKKDAKERVRNLLPTPTPPRVLRHP